MKHAINLDELNIPSAFQIGQNNYHLSLTGTPMQFVATLSEEVLEQSWTINEEGKVK